MFSDLICMEEDLSENQVMEFLDCMLSLTKHSTQQYMHFDDTVAEGFFQKRMISGGAGAAEGQEWMIPLSGKDSVEDWT